MPETSLRAWKNTPGERVLLMVTVNAYSRERLAFLLGLLPRAPRRWVTEAQVMLLEMLGRDRTAVDESSLTETQLVRLRDALDRDAAFRQSFETDPVAAAEAAGWSDLARALERETRALVALAERIAASDAMGSELDDEVHVFGTAAEPLARALADSDLVRVEPDVVAHQHEPWPLRTRLALLLVARTALAERLRTIARPRDTGPGNGS